ncbi:MAG: TolC family protein [Janthinobacterium lividum]
MDCRDWARQAIIALSLVTNHPASAQAPAQPAAQPLTLPQAWAQATDYNKELLAQRKQVAVGAELVKDRQNERLPRLPVRSEYAYLGALYGYAVNGGLRSPEAVPVPPSPHFVTASVGAEWDLYTGGRIKNDIAQQQANATLDEARLDLTQQEIRLRVAQAYLDGQRNLTYQALTESNVKESERRRKQIASLYKNGVVLRSDLLRAELQLSRQQLLLTEIGNNITLANQRLNLLMGAPENQANQLAKGILPPAVAGTYDEYLRQAQAKAPELRIAGLQTNLSELQQARTAVAKRPQIGLFSSYEYAFPNRLTFPFVPQFYSYGQVGARVSYNILGGYTDRHAEKAAVLAVERQRLAQEKALDDKREEVKTAYVRYQETLERIRIAEQSIGQATENYRIVNSTYFNQLSLLTDLLDADNQLLQARFDLVTAQVQAATHYYQLQKALGQL